MVDLGRRRNAAVDGAKAAKGLESEHDGPRLAPIGAVAALRC